MRLSAISALSGTFLLSFSSISRAAVLILDSFTEGRIALASSGESSQYATLDGADFNRRLLVGPAAGTWSLVQAPRAFGSLTLTGGTPGPAGFFRCEYLPRDGFADILGYDGVALRITGLQGRGEVAVIGNWDVRLPTTRFDIDSTGTLFIPIQKFDHLGSLAEVSKLTFAVYPRSTDFSVTIDQIALVPEPGSAGLLIAAGFALALSRSFASKK